MKNPNVDTLLWKYQFFSEVYHNNENNIRSKKGKESENKNKNR